MNDDVPFQFGIRRLMFVTCFVAVIMSVATRIGIVALMFFGSILMIMLIWAFFRGRRFVASLKTMVRQRRGVMQRRAQLEQELKHVIQRRKEKR